MEKEGNGRRRRRWRRQLSLLPSFHTTPRVTRHVPLKSGTALAACNGSVLASPRHPKEPPHYCTTSNTHDSSVPPPDLASSQHINSIYSRHHSLSLASLFSLSYSPRRALTICVRVHCNTSHSKAILVHKHHTGRPLDTALARAPVSVQRPRHHGYVHQPGCALLSLTPTDPSILRGEHYNDNRGHSELTPSRPQ